MKKIIWTIILILSLAIAGTTAYIITTNMMDDGDKAEYVDKPAAATKSAEELKKYAENHKIKWDKLKKTNKDIYAWLYVPKTKIDYPVVQPSKNKDDLYYLNRDIDKKYKFAGSIFSEKMNAKDFKDPVTVLYGHNMLNGSMFAGLHRFEIASFFKKNKVFYIYTPSRRLTYQIYSAYTYDDRHIMNSFDFGDKADLKEYQKSTLKPKSMTKNVRKVKLNAKSKIVTLSTCTNGDDNTRFLVQGVLVKNEAAK